MNTFTKTVLLLTGLFFTVATAFGKATPEKRASAMTDWMKDDLKLSAEQVGAVHVINQRYADLHENISLSNQTKEDKIRAWDITRKDKKKELRKVLTPEQYNDYVEVEEAMRQKLKEQEREERQAAQDQK